MTSIRLDGVSKAFGPHQALVDVSLDLADGSFTALLGPSGCGKTTILRLLAGFERPTAGRVLFDGAVVSAPDRSLPPEERDVGVVFQSYALWPHMTVAENVAYPLQARRRPADSVRREVAAALDQVTLSAYADRRPDALSGGQRQRVALARAIVADTRAVLFDEPLANLDVHLRARLVEEFRRIHRQTGRTMVYVTHDQAEAIALADRLVVMAAGRILQVSDPRTVYRSPASETVAAFVGRGAVVDAAATAVEAGRAAVRLAGATLDVRVAPGVTAGPVRLLLRPEALAATPGGALAGTVVRSTYRGPVSELEVALMDGSRLHLDTPDDWAEGMAIRLHATDGWAMPSA
jgi:iron(III) transport system ATP-binding protein